MGLQVREQPQLRRGERRRAGRSGIAARGDGAAKLGDLVDECAERGAVVQDIVDLLQQVACGHQVAESPVHLGELHPDAHGEIGQRERQRRTGSHRLRQLAFGLVRSPRCTASRAAPAKASTLVG